jgi:hypothetical protein
VDHQSVTFVVWLGVAVLALVWAQLSLWRTRRLLAQVRQEHCVTRVRFAQAAAHTRFSPAPAPTSQAIAS